MIKKPFTELERNLVQFSKYALFDIVKKVLEKVRNKD